MTLVEIDLRVGGAWRYVMIATGMETGIHEQLDLLDELTRELT